MNLLVVLAALAVIPGVVGGAIYYSIGAALTTLGARLGAGRLWVLLGAWLAAVPLFVALGLGFAASGIGRVGPTPTAIDTSTTQDANVQLRFTNAFVGVRPTGPANCWRHQAGAAVAEMATQNADLQSDWRWGPGLDKYVSATVWWDAPGQSDGRLLLHFADRALSSGADYQASIGGSVTGNVAPDGSSGDITFAVPHRPDKDFDPAVWPDTVSGTLAWSCSGPERTTKPE
jgi:hypothetical protein